VNDLARLAEMAGIFGPIGLITIGGVQTVLPELHRQLVVQRGWLTDADFTAAFAIAQAAPVPNILMVTLLGLRIAGAAGALVATVATVLPTCLLCYWGGRLWHSARDTSWRPRVEAGLAPVTIGLIGAAALVVSRASAATPASLALLAVAAAILIRTRLHPLWLFAAGALLGGAGVLG